MAIKFVVASNIKLTKKTKKVIQQAKLKHTNDLALMQEVEMDRYLLIFCNHLELLTRLIWATSEVLALSDIWVH